MYFAKRKIQQSRGLDEKNFIDRLIKEDRVAYQQLFDKYHEMVFNISLGFLPNREDAEDIVQEVFMEIYRSLPNFHRDSKLSTWIYRIAVNKNLALIRKRKRKKRFAFLQSLLPGDDLGVADTYAANHPGIALENQERAQKLYKAIDGLAERQRIAFTLSQIDGLSYDEICKMMSLSKSSVESLIFRARQNLRKKLKDIDK